MVDIATLWDSDNGVGEWVLAPPPSPFWTDGLGRALGDAYVGSDGLVEGSDLLTAVYNSLFCDAEASDDDVIPDGTTNRRGWWGSPVGSKLWLRLRSKASATLLALVKSDIEQALAWMIEDDIVAAIDVTTEWTRPTLLGGSVVLKRSDGARAALGFSRLWENI